MRFPALIRKRRKKSNNLTRYSSIRGTVSRRFYFIKTPTRANFTNKNVV